MDYEIFPWLMFLILLIVTLENVLANTFYKEVPGSTKGGGRGLSRTRAHSSLGSDIMNRGFSVNFSPIGGSWPILLIAVMAVTALTLWAYSKRLRGTTGRWRYFRLGSGCWRSCSA